jgi:hypothetical protein
MFDVVIVGYSINIRRSSDENHVEPREDDTESAQNATLDEYWCLKWTLLKIVFFATEKR